MSAAHEKPPWLVSLWRDRDGPLLGAGLLCTPEHIITCAHVIADVPPDALPKMPLYVRFPFVPHTDPLSVRIVPGGWHPPTPDNRADVAVLKLESPVLPDGARPALLHTTESGISQHQFLAHGFPTSAAYGETPARGTIVAHTNSEVFQVTAEAPGWPLECGFSGSPVWDVEAEAVIGMLVSRDKGRTSDRRTAYAIPVEVLTNYWPPLSDHVRRPPPPEPAVDNAALELREELEKLLVLPLTDDGEIPSVDEVDPLDIGVSPSKYSGSATGAPYIGRGPQDEALDAQLKSSHFVLLVGPTKAGKSRTMFELLRRSRPTPRLIVPRPDRSTPKALSTLKLPTGDAPAILWLDDLHLYLQPGGLDLHVLADLKKNNPRVKVVATLSSQRHYNLRLLDNDVGRWARAVLNRHKEIDLPHLLTPAEQQEARKHYPGEDFSQRGIGEQLVAAPVLEARLGGSFEGCPPGWAVTRAAADWQRMGLKGPVPEAALRALFLTYMGTHHMGLDAGDAEFAAGVEWACERVAGSISLLNQVRPAGSDPAYQAFAYIPEYLDSRSATDHLAGVPGFAWDQVTALSVPSGLLSVAYAALVRAEPEVAERILQRVLEQPSGNELTEGSGEAPSDDGSGETPSDDGSRAWAALMRGQLLLFQHDFEQAAVLLEQAVASGVADVVPMAGVELAGILMTHDRPRARRLLEEASRAADLQVAQMAQVELAGLLINEGDHQRAQRILTSVLAAGDDEIAPRAKAYIVRAKTDEADVPAMRLPGRTGRPGASPQTDRTDDPAERGTLATLPTDQPWNLSRQVGQSVSRQMVAALAKTGMGGLYVSQGRLDEAEEMLRSATHSGQHQAVALAQAGLGEVLILKERYDEAREQLEAVLRYGHPLVTPVAQVSLGFLLLQQGEEETGTQLLHTVVDSGHPDQSARAAYVLGEWYLFQDRPAEAAPWFERTLEATHPDWSGNARIGLAALAFDRQDLDATERLLREVIDSGHRENGPRAAEALGTVLVGEGRAEEAEAALRIAVDSGHGQWSLIASIDLAQLHANGNEPERAEELLQHVVSAEHPEHSSRAADLLGDLLSAQGRVHEAEAAYRVAIRSGHPQWSLIARIDLAVMLADNGDLVPAEELLRDVVRSDTDNKAAVALGQVLLGLLFNLTDRRPDGVQLLRTAAETDFPDVRQIARFYLAKCLREDGDEDRAAVLLERVIADEPSDVTGVARAYLGVMKLRQGDEEEADELLAGAEDSGDPEAMAVAYLGAGEHMLDMGEIDTARELLERTVATEVAEWVPRARALLGVVWLASEDLQKARDHLEAALADGDPSLEPMVRRYLGSTLVQTRPATAEDRRTLLAAAEQVLIPLARSEDTSHRPEALHLLARIAATQGRVEQACEWFELTIESGDPETEEEARADYLNLLLREGKAERAQQLQALRAEDLAHLEELEALRSADRDDAVSTPQGAPPGPPARPLPVAQREVTPLSSTVLVLLGDLASAEDQSQEARYWYELARGGQDQSARDAAATALARLDP